MALADLDGRLVVDRCVTHALLDLACHGEEGLLDVARVLGRGFEEWDAEAVCELLYDEIVSQIPHSHTMSASARDSHLCHRVFNHLLVSHVTLVAHKKFVHALRSIAIDLLQPLLHVVEAVHVSDIVDNADAVRSAVVG